MTASITAPTPSLLPPEFTTATPFEWLVILVFTVLAGITSWVAKVLKGKAPLSMLYLIGELTAACLAGLVIFAGCKWLGFSLYPTIACCALAGHLGGRVIEVCEQGFLKKLRKFFNLPEQTGHAPLGKD